MINRRRFKQIEEVVQGLLEQTGAFVVPVDVEVVARALGIAVVGHDFGADISGVLIHNAGQVTIGYNERDSLLRQRFTIAHEIGHYALKHQREGLFVDNPGKHFSVLFRDGNSSTGERLQEREANAFAANLLMPRALLMEYVHRTSFDLSGEGEVIQQLANDFNVSSQAMTYRLANLGVLNSAFY